MMERLAESSPRFKARLAGVFYVINIVTSLFAFSGGGGRHSLALASGYIATASYLAVTVLLYFLFKPVNRNLSLLAALFSLVGCAAGVRLIPFHISSLVFFGFYCLLIGYLIWKSTFLPRILGVLMMIAGMGWLTFLSAPLARSLKPYPYIAGGIGEGLLTLWLLVIGVNAARWTEQARAAMASNQPGISPGERRPATNP